MTLRRFRRPDGLAWLRAYGLPAEWRRQLVSWDGTGVHRAVVRADGTHWYVKPGGRSELLAYRLAAPFLNVAEVRPAPPGLLGTDGDAVMVRLGQTYARDELPLHDLDAAVAGELVFSLWIRRRDAHPANRVYTGGLPVFFDHHEAFGLVHPADRTLAGFLRDGPDAGYVPRWRVEVVAASAPLTTEACRARAMRTELALHWVHDRASFLRALDVWSAHFGRIARDRSYVDALVRETLDDRDAADLASHTLTRAGDELPLAVEHLKRMLA